MRSYQQTWLEGDLADLTRLSDLLPFRSLQRLAMLRSGQLLNYAELGPRRRGERGDGTSLPGIPASFVPRRAVAALRANLTSATVKSPKLYWMDLGLLRQGTGQWGEVTGSMFETLVIAEARKWIDTMGRDTPLSFYRTRSGREVDLLVTTRDGIIGIEVKARPHVGSHDCSGLRALASALGDEWVGGLVVHRGEDLGELEPTIWAVPAHRLF